MKIKVTNLKKDSHFSYNGRTYTKLEDYNKSNKCLDTETNDIVEIPLMSQVEQVEKKKKTRKKNEDNSEKTDSDGLRDGRTGPVDLQPDTISVDSGGSETIGDSSELGI